MGGVPGVTMGQTCMSPRRAAGCPPINTVGHPTTMLPPCTVISPILAAGIGMAREPFFGRTDGRFGPPVNGIAAGDGPLVLRGTELDSPQTGAPPPQNPVSLSLPAILE